MATWVARIAERVATRAQAALVKRLEEGRAVSADTAIAAQPAGKAEARALDRMVQFGAIVATDDGRHHLDARALANFRKEELARVLGAIAVAGFAAAGAMAMGR